jgi:hypothetical protein
VVLAGGRWCCGFECRQRKWFDARTDAIVVRHIRFWYDAADLPDHGLVRFVQSTSGGTPVEGSRNVAVHPWGRHGVDRSEFHMQFIKALREPVQLILDHFALHMSRDEIEATEATEAAATPTSSMTGRGGGAGRLFGWFDERAVIVSVEDTPRIASTASASWPLPCAIPAIRPTNRTRGA